MKISFLNTDPNHPINTHLENWIESNKNRHSIELVRKKSDLSGGDILFLISCYEIINAKDRSAYTTSLVLHASDLPKGRGWSPHIWDILNGANVITLSLLEAEDEVDSGKVLKKIKIPIENHALWNEINGFIFNAEIDLINFAIESHQSIVPKKQNPKIKSRSYRRRKPEDSRIDPKKNLVEQFDLLRVSDPERFPAFFDLYGHRYKIVIEKINNE